MLDKIGKPDNPVPSIHDQIPWIHNSYHAILVFVDINLTTKPLIEEFLSIIPDQPNLSALFPINHL